MNEKVVVFDLDDTLVKEIHYLQSAYRAIAQYIDQANPSLYQEMYSRYTSGQNVFEWLVTQYPTILTMEQLLLWYREHKPEMILTEGSQELLDYCKKSGYTLGLITDGRALTQRNKLDAVGLTSVFDLIVISEEFGSSKPTPANFEAFQLFKGDKYYIGDNVKKDFVTPNRLGWTSICVLDDGDNIHKQHFNLDEVYLPHYKVSNLREVKAILDRK